jgi:hypothetical protein
MLRKYGIDPIMLGAAIAAIITAWLNSRKK